VSRRRFRGAEVRWGDEVQEELARAIDRGGQRLGRLIAELEELAREIDRLELTLFIPGLTADVRRSVRVELALATQAFHALHAAASCTYQQLICQRERCGFRDHQLVESCFRIPDLPSVIEPDLYELRE